VAKTYGAIAQVTVGSGGSSTIAFTSIPQTYTHLKLVISARSNRASTGDYALISFNSTTADTAMQLWNSGNLFYDITTTNTTMVTPSTNTVSGAFGNTEIFVSNYADSNPKIASIDSIAEDNIAGAQGVSMGLQYWSTGSASSGGITSISIAPRFGSVWLEYTTATLYGIKNS
jgi:hypothetical protein